METDHPKSQYVTAIAGQRARLFSGFISKRNDASMSGLPRASESPPVGRSFATHRNKKFPRAAFSCTPTYIGNACLCHPLRRPSAASSSFHQGDRIRRRQSYRRARRRGTRKAEKEYHIPRDISGSDGSCSLLAPKRVTYVVARS